MIVAASSRPLTVAEMFATPAILPALNVVVTVPSCPVMAISLLMIPNDDVIIMVSFGTGEPSESITVIDITLSELLPIVISSVLEAMLILAGSP